MVAVGAIIEHTSTGKILLMKRADTATYAPGLWEDLTGRMKQFEEPEAALHREIKEETGLTVTIVKPLKVFHLYRGEPTADNELIGIVYWCRTHSDHVTLSHEHSDYRWLTPQEALDLADHPGIQQDIHAFIQEATNLDEPTQTMSS